MVIPFRLFGHRDRRLRGGRACARRSLLTIECLENRFNPSSLALVGEMGILSANIDNPAFPDRSSQISTTLVTPLTTADQQDAWAPPSGGAIDQAHAGMNSSMDNFDDWFLTLTTETHIRSDADNYSLVTASATGQTEHQFKIMPQDGDLPDTQVIVIAGFTGGIAPNSSGNVSAVVNTHPLHSFGSQVHYLAQLGDTIDVDMDGTTSLGVIPAGAADYTESSVVGRVGLNAAHFRLDPGGPYSITEGNGLQLLSPTQGALNTFRFAWDVKVDGQWITATPNGQFIKGATTDLRSTDLKNLGITAAKSPYEVRVEVTDTVGGFTMISPSTTLTVKPDLSLAVSTPWNQENNDAAHTFGPFLPRIALRAPFSIVVTDPQHQVASLKWSIAGGESGLATRVGKTQTWTFNPNVGLAASGALTITPYDASGHAIASGVFQGMLDVKPLPLVIQIQASSPGALATDVGNLRFLQGIPLAETFTGTVSGIPPEYNGTAVRVYVGSTAYAGTLPRMAFAVNVGTLGAKTKVQATIGGVPLSTLSSNPLPELNLIASSIPAWLKGPKPVVRNGVYEFDKVNIPVAKQAVAIPATGTQWLDAQLKNLTTSFTLTPSVNVLIPIAASTDGPKPSVVVNSLTAQFILANQTVWTQVYGAKDVIAALKLNPQTLNVDDLSLALAHPGQVPKPQTFLNRTFSVPIPTSLTPAVTVTASLALKLTGSLTINGAGMELTYNGKNLAFVSSGTFVDMTALAHGTATAPAKATVVGGWLGTFTASASMTADLSISGRAELGGSAGLKGILTGSYKYSLAGTPKSTKQQVKVIDQPAGTFGPWTLFTL